MKSKQGYIYLKIRYKKIYAFIVLGFNKSSCLIILRKPDTNEGKVLKQYF